MEEGSSGAPMRGGRSAPPWLLLLPLDGEPGGGKKPGLLLVLFRLCLFRLAIAGEYLLLTAIESSSSVIVIHVEYHTVKIYKISFICKIFHTAIDKSVRFNDGNILRPMIQ